MNSHSAIVMEPQISQSSTRRRPHLGFFDGLRGWLCIYVMIFHSAMMTGFFTRLLPGPLVVDLFILISGFFMTYTLTGKNAALSGDAIIAFYLRRIFRVVPVYYIVLLAAIILFTTMAHFSAEANAAFPPLWAKDVGHDPSYRVINFTNIILHMTFLFGLNPHYASNLPIPDWSLTLEMQFYALVPFILIAFRKYGLVVSFFVLALINFLALKYIGLYLEPKVGGLWPQPSFIIFKIDCFLSGILLCLYFFDETFSKIEILGLLMISLVIEDSIIFAIFVMFSFACLEGASSGRSLFAHITKFFSGIFQSRILHFFSIISYDLYLAHLMILLTIMHLLLKSERFVACPPIVRFGLLLGIGLAVVVPVSYILHIAVERPCQNASRAVCDWILARKKHYLRPRFSVEQKG